MRAVEPLEGIARSTAGPGKLTRALVIDRSHNGEEVVAGSRLFLEEAAAVGDSEVEVSPRIGIDYADDWAERPWRWSLRGNRHVSKRR